MPLPHREIENLKSEAETEPLDVLFFGTGTSHGIPMIACDCAVCRSSDPRDKRDRASLLLSWGGHNVVIDTGAEFRRQVLANGVTRLGAVFYTHCHADHIHGIDDVRGFNVRARDPIPVFADFATAGFLMRTFSYIFAADPSTPNLPRMDLRVVGGAFELFGRTIVPVPIYHAEDLILGYRVGGLAYLTDCSGLPDESWPLLEGLDTLVVGALRPTPHPKHFSLDQALEFIERVSPRRAYLCHISHKLSHRELERDLPDDVRPAYDGLRVRVDQRRATGQASLHAPS